jgi:hypothetical protein
VLLGVLRTTTWHRRHENNLMDSWCTGNGLLPGGVRESYCLQLYPNTSGVPSGS